MVGEIPVDFRLRLPDKPEAHLEEWTLWGEGVLADASEDDADWSADDVERVGRARARRATQCGPALKPWKTLLRLSSEGQGGATVVQTCWDAPELQESVDLLMSALDPTETCVMPAVRRPVARLI